MMKIIGLTGPSGAGKGYISNIFSDYGIKSIDTDRISRAVCEKGSRCLLELEGAFGSSIIREDGTLDRRRLADIAFSDEEKHLTLNRITHGHILLETKRLLDEYRASGESFAIVDAPLLFESGFDSLCDYTVAVVAEYETRLARVINRDGISRSDAEKRFANQQNIDFYIEKSDYTVYNNLNESKESIRKQVEKIWRDINAGIK